MRVTLVTVVSIVIVPTHNERNNILPLMHNLKQSSFQTSAGVHFVIADDNSPDNTADIIRNEPARGNKTIPLVGRSGRTEVVSAYTAGIFRWILEGHHNVISDIILQIDADLSYPILIEIPMLKAIETGGADFAFASLY